MLPDAPNPHAARPFDDTSLVDLRCSVAVIGHGAILLLERVGSGDWVLPGGRPKAGESMASCARRETREETGLNVNPESCALVLEVIDPLTRRRVVELVFRADGRGLGDPSETEPGMRPHWMMVDRLSALNLRPPVAGYIPAIGGGTARTAPYLGNLWRPEEDSWASDPMQATE